MNDYGWHCECGHWLSESVGEPKWGAGKMCCSVACASVFAAEETARFDSLPCNAIDGKLSTMGNSGKCKVEDQSTHSAKCLACGKVGWYSERGRLAEEQGVQIWDVKLPV